MSCCTYFLVLVTTLFTFYYWESSCLSLSLSCLYYIKPFSVCQDLFKTFFTYFLRTIQDRWVLIFLLFHNVLSFGFSPFLYCIFIIILLHSFVKGFLCFFEDAFSQLQENFYSSVCLSHSFFCVSITATAGAVCIFLYWCSVCILYQLQLYDIMRIDS